MNLNLLIALSAFFLGPTLLSAREILVPAPGQLAAALSDLQPGDVVTLKNGSWRDTNLMVTKGGAAGRPVEIRAETPGGVILTGTSALTLNAPYVTVDGLRFQGGAISRGAVIACNSHHGIVLNTAVIDYNPAAFETGYYWVFFSGDHNRVEHCYFKGKGNMEPVIGNALADSRHNAVVRSLFINIPYVPNANGREIIRVWGSGKIEEADDDGAYFAIEDNLFDHADGEGTEIISLKSNHNVVRRNSVVATRGGINIRRGNFNTLQDNIVLGRSTDGAHGLRMSGRDNLVQGNFVSGCDYGIRVACGEFITGALTAAYTPDLKPNGRKSASVRIPTYPQVVRLTLADNVVVGSRDLDLEVGSDYKKHWPASQQVLLPEDCVITHNRFVRPRGGVAVALTVAERETPLDLFTFHPNQFSGNQLVGAQDAPPPAGFDPQTLPPLWTVAAESARFKPLTIAEVGPPWVAALRSANQFPEETAASGEVPRGEPAAKKKNR